MNEAMSLIPNSPWQLASTTALPTHQPSRKLYFFTEALPLGARNIHPVQAPIFCRNRSDKA
jgi:hypothetical protein